MAMFIQSLSSKLGIVFAIVPLFQFTKNKEIMGNLKNGRLTNFVGIIMAVAIISLNIFIIYQYL